MQPSQPIVKDLVLLGGGHSHAIVLRMWGMKPMPGVRLTLITERVDTPYSGMLPGHIAGFYTHDECHIDLRQLANFAQAQLYIDKAIGLDLENQQVICANHPNVAFDILSIDIGSTPTVLNVPGAAEYAIPAKPVSKLLEHWEDLCQDPNDMTIAIVGGGAGGVELSLAMQANLQRLHHPKIHLFHHGAELMREYHPSARRKLAEVLNQRGIHVHLPERVCQVEPQKVICESGLQVECNKTFWVTQADSPLWLKNSDCDTDARGFIQVNDYLQSVSHPNIFAAGDIASMVNYTRPKAGVFAVRQGKPLFENLQRILTLQQLQPYKPQKEYLSLIGTGKGEAIASRGSFTSNPHKLLWRAKDWIDRRFMERFQNLPAMGSEESAASPSPSLPSMRCAGCGSKVSSTVLELVLSRIPQQTDGMNDIVIGLDAPDDAAVLKIPTGQLLVQTIDYFRALISDPYIFGQISANHCLSDIFAMGASPQSALALATIPYAAPAKVEETLYQLLSGAVKVLNQATAPLIGGHTTEGAELGFGLACNGLVYPDKLLRKSGMQPGQVLILTKALGTGTLFAADMRAKAKGRWIDDAVKSMLQSNQAAATCLLQHGATACTDVTGFGLLGHLMEMVRASQVAVELQLPAIPILDGARETVQQGIVSSIQPDNLRAERYIANLDQHHPNYPLLFDPQTSGGLLASIPHDQVESCLNMLKTLGYSQSRAIARIVPQVTTELPIIIVD